MTQTLHTPLKPRWTEQVFGAKIVAKGGVIRRAIRDVDREIGRMAFELEVRRRGYHLIESDTQYIVICNTGHIRLIC
ncbi:N-(5'-phosphoribosyl)anthranilate isomerase [Gemmobacter aquarius]|uniref:N-(5'-phosphoribosyl)anthranilate isomerase n=1 Tax=Paragemmobacter aquarius TaxID=2169400 RepID=A0A2S0ULX1_9RHOB|nr:N-(5'-phosphoribosyl)anthranilate isomerase [Gemmobacter aquarius]AWB48819.1 N-(5'-phosphoribosyl)anthranilate isomerase [Gemmobacter aquarius]